jgi:hypothetical protein
LVDGISQTAMKSITAPAGDLLAQHRDE